MSAPRKYPPEVRDRAVRLVHDLLADEQLQLSVTGACRRVGEQLGINRDTLRGLGEAGPDRRRHSTGGV
jgi:transposase